MAIHGDCTLAELAQKLHISIPTVTKLIDELVQDKIIIDRGKISTSGGRRPNIFGLANSTIYFAGVEISRDQMVLAITDLQNNIITTQRNIDFILEDTDECLNKICQAIENFLTSCSIDRSKLLGVGVCIAGRVNPETGRSYKYFTSNPQSLDEIIESYIGHPVLIENDTRAKCYGEYTKGCTGDEKNIIYLNLGRGVAIGIIVDGKIYYGRSGFAGEFGHTPFFENEIICDCGKKGCLETEVSGIAIENKQVIIGGYLAGAGDYLMLPLKSAVNKFSLRLVYNDTLFRTTKLDDNIGALGAAMLIRNKIIGI